VSNGKCILSVSGGCDVIFCSIATAED